MNVRARLLIFISFILIGLGLISIFQFQNLSETRLIFCDVGQGDGILIQSGTKQVVIDGGPGNKMVDCLSEKMPYWDHSVEMMVSTHPQQDHMEGLLGVLEKYDVGTVVTTNVPHTIKIYDEWQRLIKAEVAKVYEPNTGDKFVVDGSSTMTVLWPDQDQVNLWQQNPPKDLNETSIVMRLDTGPSTSSGSSRCAYLTGDIPKEILEGLIDRPCRVLKIAHHGSRTGTSEEILDKAKPKVAVIQAGRNNRYGHPHKEVIDLLVSKGLTILRNDTDGTVEIDIDDKGKFTKFTN